MRDISVWWFPVGLTFCYIVKRKEKGKRTVSEISSLFVGSSPIKISLYFKCTLVSKSFGHVISSVDLTSFAHICFSLVSLSLILAKRLIASFKHYKGILEIWLQLIFSNPEVRSSAIWGGRKTKDLVVYVKMNWHPLTDVWDQSRPKFTPTLFASLHMPEIGVLTGTYFAECQVPDCPRRHMRIKWTLVLGWLFMQRHTMYYEAIFVHTLGKV